LVARRVGVEARAQLGRQAAEHPAQVAERVEVAAGHHVALEAAGAEHGGERAGGGAPEQLELHEAVLRQRVADARPQLLVVRGADAGHAVGVPHDRDPGRRRLARAGRPEARRLEPERLEERELVVEVRVRARQRHVAGLARREHALGADHATARRGGARQRGDEDGHADPGAHGAPQYGSWPSRCAAS
jgi:hypothetical protein